MIANEFVNAVESNDVLMARIMLKDSLLVDPTFREFNEMLAYAESKMDIYEEHDGETLKNDASAWSKDYMNEQLMQLVNNFSKERIALLKRICGKIYAEKAERIQSERVVTKTNKKITQKEIGIGLAVGGTAAAVVGLATAHTVVTVAGVAVAVVGGVMIATDK